MFQAIMNGNVSYGEHPRQSLDICVPQQCKEPPPLLLCFHSGWLQSGQRELLRPLLLELAERGYAAASIGYRLQSDGVQLNDILEDCRAGIAYARDEAQLLGVSELKPCLLGSGIGGLLALNCALNDAGACAGVIACGATPVLQTWDGCNPAMTQAIESVTSKQPELRETCSPLLRDCSTLPPLLLLHGDHDPEVPVKLIRELHARCIEQDVASTFSVLSGAQHRFLENNGSRAAQSAVKRIDDWLQQRYFNEQDSLPVADPAIYHS